MEDEEEEISSSTPGLDLYREDLMAMPQRSKPSTMNKIVTALGGAFFGPEKALEMQDMPYQKSIHDWAMKTKSSGELANLEVKDANSKALRDYRKSTIDSKNADIARKQDYGEKLLAQRAREAKDKLDVALQNARTNEDRAQAYREYINNMDRHHKETESISREKNAIARDRSNKPKVLSPSQSKVAESSALQDHMIENPNDRPIIMKYKESLKGGDALTESENMRMQQILSKIKKRAGTMKSDIELDPMEDEEDEDLTIEEE